MKSFLFLTLLGLVLAGCEHNPGWDGSKPSTAKGELAKETCKCVYEVMAEMSDLFDVDAILDKSEGSEKDREIALQMEEAISIKVDECECMEPVNDAAFNKGVELEELLNELDGHCSLGVFYN